MQFLVHFLLVFQQRVEFLVVEPHPEALGATVYLDRFEVRDVTTDQADILADRTPHVTVDGTRLSHRIAVFFLDVFFQSRLARIPQLIQLGVIQPDAIALVAFVDRNLFKLDPTTSIKSNRIAGPLLDRMTNYTNFLNLN